MSDILLKKNKNAHNILRALSHFTYFLTFNDTAKEEACSIGKIVTFKTEETIFGDGKGNLDHVYFILSGECQVIEILLIKTQFIGRKQFYSLCNPKKISPETNEHSTLINTVRHLNKHNKDICESINAHYMQVYVMGSGGCFNIGETLTNRRIVAVGDVQCLLLPRRWLMNWNPANIWPRIKQYLERKIPNHKKAFEEFKRNQQWEAYKQSLINEVIEKKQSSSDMTVHYVPYSVRLQNNFDCKEYENRLSH